MTPGQQEHTSGMSAAQSHMKQCPLGLRVLKRLHLKLYCIEQSAEPLSGFDFALQFGTASNVLSLSSVDVQQLDIYC
ncbi:hypothetical protein TNCV_3188471 [Trichonephila clavipes]|nr:hypothetical protein TNCV_3188471 [Trichonephila clavipes]